jgi:hypothetical protein
MNRGGDDLLPIHCHIEILLSYSISYVSKFTMAASADVLMEQWQHAWIEKSLLPNWRLCYPTKTTPPPWPPPTKMPTQITAARDADKKRKKAKRIAKKERWSADQLTLMDTFIEKWIQAGKASKERKAIKRMVVAALLKADPPAPTWKLSTVSIPLSLSS